MGRSFLEVAGRRPNSQIELLLRTSPELSGIVEVWAPTALSFGSPSPRKRFLGGCGSSHSPPQTGPWCTYYNLSSFFSEASFMCIN